MLSRNMTQNVHLLIKSHLKEWGKEHLIAMDGTLGNGYDLEFLNNQEEISTIYGFDIQACALKNSKERIGQTSKSIHYIQDSHHHLENYIEGEIDLALFNLGYLPGADKSIVTKVDTTLEAIEKTIHKLSRGGLLVIMTYPGHEEGMREHESVKNYLSSMHKNSLSILQICVNNVIKACPNCFLIIKKI